MQITFSYFLADFLSGIIHWWEDRYIKSNTPLLGKFIGEPNERHHREPNYFLQFGYFRRIGVSSLIALITGLIIWFLNLWSWQAGFILLLLSQANQIHAWAHGGRTQNGKLISFLQKMGLLQSTKHHAKHHMAPHTLNYCILTNWLNPILNKFQFWTFLENGINWLCKVLPLIKTKSR